MARRQDAPTAFQRREARTIFLDARPERANVAKNAIVYCGRAIERWGAYRKAGKAARFVGFPKFRTVKRTGCRRQADNGAELSKRTTSA